MRCLRTMLSGILVLGIWSAAGAGGYSLLCVVDEDPRHATPRRACGPRTGAARAAWQSALASADSAESSIRPAESEREPTGHVSILPGLPRQQLRQQPHDVQRFQLFVQFKSANNVPALQMQNSFNPFVQQNPFMQMQNPYLAMQNPFMQNPFMQNPFMQNPYMQVQNPFNPFPQMPFNNMMNPFLQFPANNPFFNNMFLAAVATPR